MPLGNQISQGSVNSALGRLCNQWQTLAYNSQQFAALIAGLPGGTIAGLEALGFNVTDATNFGAFAVQLGQLAGIYYGTDTPQSAGYNYDAAFAPLRGTGPG